MIRTKILLILPLVVAVFGQGNRGIGYYGTSNVRDQRPLPQPLYRPRPMLPGRLVSLQPVVAAPSPPVTPAAPAVPAVSEATLVAEPAAPAAAPAIPTVPAYPAAPIINSGTRPSLYPPMYRPILPPRLIRPVLQPTVASQTAKPVAVVPETPLAAATQPLLEASTQPAVIAAPQPLVQVASQPSVETAEPVAPESPVLEPESEPAGPIQPEPENIPEESFEPEPAPISSEELAPAPIDSPLPEEPAAPVAVVSAPVIEAEPIADSQLTQPTPIPELALAPEPIGPSVVKAPISILQPKPIQESGAVPQLEPVQETEADPQPGLIQESETVPQINPIEEPETITQPDAVQVAEPLPSPAGSADEGNMLSVERNTLPNFSRPLIPRPINIAPTASVYPVAPIASVALVAPIAPKPGALPPLLPKPKPIREPVFGGRPNRSTPPTIFYPTPSYVTHSSAAPTQAPPVVITTQSYPVVTRPTGTLKLDFQCKEENGYYPVAKECDTYIECKQDIATKYSCPDGLHFNPATKHFEYPCAYPSEVKCTVGAEEQNPKPTDHCPNQYGYYSMNDGDCSKFIMCQEGLATIMDCPMGLVFNSQTSSCDWPANVPQCNPKIFQDFTCPEAPVDEYGQVSDVIYKYRYGHDCKLYVACQRARPRLLSCERGLSFDDASQSCVDEDYVTDCVVAYDAAPV